MINGTVTDASTGEALSGANVMDGTSKGAAADARGSFTINNVPNGNISPNDSYLIIDDASTSKLSTCTICTRNASAWVLARWDEKTPVFYTTASKTEMKQADHKIHLWR